MTMLDSHLQRITDRITHLAEQPSTMARDLLLEELRQCYDAVLDLPIAEAQPHVTKAEPDPVPPPEPVLEPSAPPVPKPVQENEEPVAEVDAVPSEVVSEPQEASEEKGESAVEAVQPEAAEEKADDATILAGKLNRKPISDLRSGIPLNEKFGIIRNLFGGNASDFGDAVLKLNNSKSVEEMKHYFQLLTQRRDWDMESESYQVFLSYIDRRATTLATSDADPDQ